MEENISYRRLKSLKPLSISCTSPRLLRPTFRHRSQDKKQRVKQDIMNQNVTQYQYMLQDPHLKQNYINWATNLRSYTKPSGDEKQQIAHPPSVFFKSTALQQLRKKGHEKSKSSHVNTAQFSQFFGKNSTILPQNEINFLNELRKINLKLKSGEGSTLKHTQIFKNFGGKQNANLPRLLKKTAIKKLRSIGPEDYEQEMDGSHQFPQYSYKNLRQKNSNLLFSLTKPHDNVSLPGIAWSVGLRNY